MQRENIGKDIMKTRNVTAAQVRAELAELLEQVARGDTRILVEEQRRPVAALLSAEDLDRLNRLEAQQADDRKILQEISDAFADVPVEELEAEVAKALAEGAPGTAPSAIERRRNER